MLLFIFFPHSSWVWIGLADGFEENNFRWIDTSPINYRNWMQWLPEIGEPTGGTNENCIVIQRQGKWIDVGCEAEYPYLCEFGKSPIRSEISQ